MSMFVALIVTFVLTLANHGFEGFIGSWTHSFLIAWAIAFVSVLIVAPRVRRLVQWLTASGHS